MMTIPRCASQRCINIRTMNDCRLEGDEKFKVNLHLVNTLTTIRTNSSDLLTVTIEDNDSKTHLYDTHSSLSPPFLSQGVRVQLEQTVYRVLENSTNVELCAILNSQDCRPEVPVPIRIYTTPDSAGRNQAPLWLYLDLIFL